MRSIKLTRVESSNSIPWWDEVQEPAAGFKLANGLPFRVRLHPVDPDSEKIREIITAAPYAGGNFRDTPVPVDGWSDVLAYAVAPEGIPEGYRVFIGSSDETEIIVP
ncbi:MAG: hypothetical protein LBP56_05260 [Odoribacteraceae bacterium]|jgi:hypothetical protein|nr:hypothetical protein [Odoribacteraceae bacterium]